MWLAPKFFPGGTLWNYCYIHGPSPLPAYFYIVGLLRTVSKSFQLYAETVPGYIMATDHISSIKQVQSCYVVNLWLHAGSRTNTPS